VSGDGPAWEPIADPGAPVPAVVGGGPGDYLGTTGQQEVVRSDDGLTWIEVAESDGFGTDTEIYRFHDGWILTQTDWGSEAWVLSADGIHWEPLPTRLTDSWLSASVVGDTILVVDWGEPSSRWSLRVGRLTD
jgi:hypothetical protein